jgi:polysaccharide export outer membrane protein
VTFPLVGDVFVFNRTIPEVNQFLDKRYDEIISGLHCDLFLETHSGSVIYVLGHVNRPGAYKIPRPVTLFEALSLAEGATRGAQLSSIIVVRKYGDKLVATRVDLKDNLAFKEESKLFFLTANDIVYVPKTWVTNTAEVARDVGDIIFFRGWGISTPSISWSK